VEVPLWGVAAFGVVVLLFVVLLWSIMNRRPAHVTPQHVDRFTEILPSIAGLTQGPILEGNRVEVIQDAAFFDALLADVARAEESVHFETYVWWTGDVCRRVAEAFAERARAGVQVRVLVDAVGGGDMDDEIRALMEDAGVDVADFHPLSFRTLGQYNNRDHRKLAIVDGRIGYTFGHGVASEWSWEGEVRWRDTAIRMEGPVVGALQGVFLENWVETTTEVPVGESVFPDLAPAGDVRAHVVASSHLGQASTVELLYKVAIASATEELLIQNPYFLPDEDLLGLIVDAAARGVRVRIMLPGAEGTDNKVVYHASHTHYPRLLEAGVELYHYDAGLLHQKVLVIDGLWSHVGSTNFDSRSFEINEEVSVGVLDEGVARELAAAFERDLAECDAFTWEDWHGGRSLWHRATDWAAHLVHEQI
jgi:cardiolipin synthase A/B